MEGHSSAMHPIPMGMGRPVAFVGRVACNPMLYEVVRVWPEPAVCERVGATSDLRYAERFARALNSDLRGSESVYRYEVRDVVLPRTVVSGASNLCPTCHRPWYGIGICDDCRPQDNTEARQEAVALAEVPA